MPAPAQPPPDLPFMPEVGPKLTDYLRRFSLWSVKSLAAKFSASEALPSVLLLANDAPPGAPKVFKLEVDSAGALVVTAVPLGTGRP